MGIVLAGWLILPPPRTSTLDPGESVSTDLRAEAGDYLMVVINVHDLAPGVYISTCVQSAPGEPPCSGMGGHFSGVRSLRLVKETDDYTVVITNTGNTTVTIDYRVITTSRVKLNLSA